MNAEILHIAAAKRHNAAMDKNGAFHLYAYMRRYVFKDLFYATSCLYGCKAFKGFDRTMINHDLMKAFKGLLL